ncbi:hypothetical protein [Paraburkholderia pallida]|uniref:Spermidine synthase n=1 Tax=Paraburkholderia pallida TaxID=2547399 RepID=A0A4P7D603_9BURK|nr:hypothetical protein [Paraburkholderia pallida]QBR04206.1 hypothetical protein E1956_44575 [Paraburkholderia pallida]
MIGLGGGSLAKYCYRYRPESVIAAVEINPHVIALRNVFHLPADDTCFFVVCADGAEYVAMRGHRPDVQLVDGFGVNGCPQASARVNAATHAGSALATTA